MSPRTIHFWVLDKSPVSGPGRGPSSCKKCRLWRGLFFTATDILTTWGPQGTACPLMDQTQQLRLGPFCLWSPPDEDSWPDCPDPVRNKRLYCPLYPSLSFLCLTLPILPPFSSPPVLDTGIWSKGLSVSWGWETDHLLLAENSNSRLPWQFSW